MRRNRGVVTDSILKIDKGRTGLIKAIYKIMFLIAVTATLTVTSAATGATSEYDQKAEFIYKFSKFIQWPDKTGELTICIYGRDPFGSSIDNLNNKPVNNRTVRVIRTQSIDRIRACHIAFISNVPEEPRYYNRVMRRINSSNVLTMANSDRADEFRVMIGLMNNMENITFKANKDIVKKSSLSISSKLLRLSKE